MDRNADRIGREAAAGRGFGAAVAAASAGLMALLLAIPILYHRIGDSRQRLDLLLCRARTVRQHEQARVAAIRSKMDERVDEAARAHDELLTFLERGVQRLLPRPVVEVRLPESAPLPKDVTPSVAPHDPSPAPRTGVFEPPQKAAAPEGVDPSVAEVVESWIVGMTRSLGLTAVQQERVREICTEYLTKVRATLERERKSRSGHAFADLRQVQDRAIRRIESHLTAEQRVTYERLEKDVEMMRKAGVVVPPLPGVRGTRK